MMLPRIALPTRGAIQVTRRHGTRWGTPCPDPSCGLDLSMCLSSEHRKQPEPEPLNVDALDRLLRDVRRRRAALAKRDEGRAA